MVIYKTDSFKRLNKNGLLILIGPFFLLLISSGCKKKERLAASTFSFSITPSASTVVKTDSLTLTARGSSSSGAVGVDPTWTVSASSLASLSPSIGQTVVLQPSALGDVVVTATYEGQTATSQIAIVTYIPSSNTFDVYNDNGLPTGSTILSDIFVDGGLSLAELSTGYTPEGIKFQRTTDAVGGDWGVTLAKAPMTGGSKDLSAFLTPSRTLKFSLRLGRIMTGAETFRIDLADTGATQTYTLVRGTDFSFLSTEWQEISLPLSSKYPALNLTVIKVPFAIVPSGIGLPLTFDVDAIRWEK